MAKQFAASATVRKILGRQLREGTAQLVGWVRHHEDDQNYWVILSSSNKYKHVAVWEEPEWQKYLEEEARP